MILVGDRFATQGKKGKNIFYSNKSNATYINFFNTNSYVILLFMSIYHIGKII